MTERHVEDLSWPFNAFIRALVPANFFLSNQTAAGKAISEGHPSPVLKFLQLTMYLVSNNLLGSTTQVSEEAYKWIKRQSNVDIMEYLLLIGGPTVEALTENLFRLAIDSEDVSTVKKMMDLGHDPNEQVCHNEWGDCRTPLMQACEMKNVKLVKALIDKGANVDAAMGNGNFESVLTAALTVRRKNGKHRRVHIDPELIRILLDAGAVVDPGSGESLAYAVELGQVELVELLVSAGADVNILVRNKIYKSNLLYIAAAQDGHIPDTNVIEMARILLNAGADPNGTSIDTALKKIKTVLDIAMRRKSVELIQLLLENGARVTESAFVEAVYHCGLDIVNLLLKFGGHVTELVVESAVESNPALVSFLLDIADEKLKGKCKTAALIRSIQFRNMSLIQSLSVSGAQLEKSYKLEHAIHEAIKAGDTNILKFLLDRESNYRVPSLESLDTAMWAAITYGRDDIVKMLMASAPDVCCAFSDGTMERNVLLAAILKKDLQLAKLLLEFGAPVNHGYYSILPAAVDLGYHPLIQDIVKAGAEIDAPLLDIHGETALFIAVRKRDTNAMNILLAAGADVNTPAAVVGQTALNAACHNNNLKIVQYLLELGADSDEWSLVEAISGSLELVQILLTARLQRYKRYSKGYGCGALQRAIHLKNVSMIEFLLAKGIDPNAIYSKKFRDVVASHSNLGEYPSAPRLISGQSALCSAIRQDTSNDSSMVRMLLRGGADPNNIINNSHESALLVAIHENSFALIKVLIEAGANPNPSLQPGVKRTPLQLATEKGRVDIVNLLLDNGADINAPPFDRYGATALQFAAIGGYVGIAQLLIQRGADINAESAKIGGRTALEGAAEHGRIDMLQLLLSSGAQIIGTGLTQYNRAREFALKNGHRAAWRLLEKFSMEISESLAGCGDVPNFAQCDNMWMN